MVSSAITSVILYYWAEATIYSILLNPILLIPSTFWILSNKLMRKKEGKLMVTKLKLKLLNCSIAVQRVLFDFTFKKLFNKWLAFSPLYHDLYRLLLATSKDHLVLRMLFVL